MEKKQRKSLKEFLINSESFCESYLAILNSSMPCILITGFIFLSMKKGTSLYGFDWIVPIYLLIFPWVIWLIPTYMKIKKLGLKNKKMILALIVIYVLMMTLFTVMPFTKD